MISFLEKIFKKEEPSYNYVIGEYKPSHGRAMSKPSRATEYDVDEALDKDEMDIDNIYSKR